MVSHLERSGVLQRPDVAAAMRAVPRHLFLPNATLEDAYADRAISLKSTGAEVVSSISQPGMIALMLELLALSPGNRVLEIGTGSGYNAALIAWLVGSEGSVTTIDLDEELVARANATLTELGYRNVTVAAGDGGLPVAQSGAYDRIIVTARGDDVAAAWWESLADGGRIVLPLRIEGAGEYAVGFKRDEHGRLRSVGIYPCAFIALRGDPATPRGGDIFYRRPIEEGRNPVCLRRVAEIVAVRREDATPSLLGEADIVVARPVTLFAVTFV
jgi:protein-L-isoaspartate(D-aspartate) O-methyltransferase